MTVWVTLGSRNQPAAPPTDSAARVATLNGTKDARGNIYAYFQCICVTLFECDLSEDKVCDVFFYVIYVCVVNIVFISFVENLTKEKVFFFL